MPQPGRIKCWMWPEEGHGIGLVSKQQESRPELKLDVAGKRRHATARRAMFHERSFSMRPYRKVQVCPIKTC